MKRQSFEDLVETAIRDLPAEFADRIENVAFVVQDWPSPIHLARAGTRRRRDLLGLYEGVPLTERGSGYNMVVPDKITIFRKPIELHCASRREVEEDVRRVVYHEIAHYFGIDEERLRMLESRRGPIPW